MDRQENQKKRKQKGGQEKVREKKAKLLSSVAEKCLKINQMFGSTSTNSTPDSSNFDASQSSPQFLDDVSGSATPSTSNAVHVVDVSVSSSSLDGISRAMETIPLDDEVNSLVPTSLVAIPSASEKRQDDTDDDVVVAFSSDSIQNSRASETILMNSNPSNHAENFVQAMEISACSSASEVNVVSDELVIRSSEIPNITKSIPVDNNIVQASEMSLSRAFETTAFDDELSSDSEISLGLLSESDSEMETNLIVENVNHEGINFFARPSKNELSEYLNFHPRQNTNDKVIRNALLRNNNTAIKWLSVSPSNGLFCFICLAFSKTVSPFTSGCIDRRHIHQRIQQHEASIAHENAITSYLRHKSNQGIDAALFANQITLRNEKIAHRRLILLRIIDVVKFIGKRGLASRGSNFEAAYYLADENLDHGNFLDLVLLLSKYDSVLHDHVAQAIKNSREKKGKRGRGNMLTFLSKNVFNRIRSVIVILIRKKIVEEIIATGMFTVQIDTSQDICSQDQISIVIRYVTNKVHERLLFLLRCDKSTGEYFADLVDKSLKSVMLSLTEAIGSATDGASNMRGCFNGFKSHALSLNPMHIHIWCFSHRLNLVISAVSSIVIPSINLFGILNEVAVFIKDSYQRMTVWDNFEHAKLQNYRHKKLSVIGETRWWAKDAALTKIFGEIQDPSSGLYTQLVLVLQHITTESTFNPQSRFKAKCLLDNFTKFETILTAFIYKFIYNETNVLSNHLQASNYDLISATVLISSTTDSLKFLESQFELIYEKSIDFLKYQNEILKDDNIVIKEEIKETRSNDSPLDHYKKSVFDKILRSVVDCMENRYSENLSIFKELGNLHPLQFVKISQNGLPEDAFKILSKHIIKYKETATPENLRNELINLAKNWDNFQELFKFEYEHETTDEFGDVNVEKKHSCNKCLGCVFVFLEEYNLLKETYSNIAIAYKFSLTLSFTQVACERSFSTLTYIKTRIRSTQSPENLQDNMIMHREKDILTKIQDEEILNEFGQSSELLKKTLLY